MANILSFNMTHTSTAVVFKDGKLAAAISEERFTRSKNEHGFPKLAIKECLETAGITSNDIDLIVYPSNYDYKYPGSAAEILFLSDKEREDLIAKPYLFLKQLKYLFFPKNRLFEQILRKYLLEEGFKPDIEIKFYNHHEAHAASAYYCSAYREALVVTFDGYGDNLFGTVYLGKGKEMKLIKKEVSPCSSSPGFFYASLTAHLGFRPNLHEGKIVGLAAFGNPLKYYHKMKDKIELKRNRNCISFKDKGKVFYKWIDPYGSIFIINLLKTYILWPLQYLFGMSYNAIKKNSEIKAMDKYFINEGLEYAKREDIAAGGQKLIEDRLCEYISFYANKFRQKNLALAGGVFSNVKLNQKLFNLPGIKNIFIQPAMGDEGLALGACYLYLKKEKHSVYPQPLGDVYLGCGFTDGEIEAALKKAKYPFKKIDKDNLGKLIARDIDKGKIVGLFQGRMEYGPRALGNRSVLADPRNRDINNILNARMKRTEFMPFAPSVLEKDFEKVFTGKLEGARYTAEFMTITFRVKKEWEKKIPAIIHVDGTARPQIVRKQINPFYYNIINEFKRLSGIPLIINTSFNMHEEPIVATPQDALKAFDQKISDVLILENYYVTKN